MRKTIVCMLVLLWATPAAAVNVPGELPPAVCSALETCRMVGKGRLRWWGFHVYDAALWSRDGRWRADAPYVLDIIYARNITSTQLAETSIEWVSAMNRNWPAGKSQCGAHFPMSSPAAA